MYNKLDDEILDIEIAIENKYTTEINLDVLKTNAIKLMEYQNKLTQSKREIQQQKRIQNCYDEFVKIYEYNCNYIIEELQMNIDRIKKNIVDAANLGDGNYCITIDINKLDITFYGVFVRHKHFTEYLNICNLLNIAHFINMLNIFDPFRHHSQFRLFNEWINTINNIDELAMIINKFIKEYIKSNNIFSIIADFTRYCNSDEYLTFSNIKKFKMKNINNYITDNIDKLFIHLVKIDKIFCKRIKDIFVGQKINGIKEINLSQDKNLVNNHIIFDITIHW